MRYYVDTNILIFLLWREREGLSPETLSLFSDYENTMLTSTVCVHELIHLLQIGKLPLRRNKEKVDIKEFEEWLEMMSVQIKPVTIEHLRTLASLPLFPDHHDPNDRLIIAQAISDRISLVSSDRKFCKYQRYGLDFIANER